MRGRVAKVPYPEVYERREYLGIDCAQLECVGGIRGLAWGDDAKLDEHAQSKVTLAKGKRTCGNSRPVRIDPTHAEGTGCDLVRGYDRA